MRNSSGYSWEIHPNTHEKFILILIRNSSGYSWEINPNTHEKFIQILKKFIRMLMKSSSGYCVKIIPKRIYDRYTSVSRDQNFLQWQHSKLVTWYRRRHVTIILHCHWLEFWWHVPDAKIILSILSIKNEKLFNSNNNRSKLEFL